MAVIIGGMTYENYDSELDSNGSIGIALADARLREERDLELIRESERILSRWGTYALIALPRFPEIGLGESVRASEIKLRINKLESAGYSCADWKRVSARNLWSYFSGIRADIRRNAGKYVPEVLDRIDMKNSETRELAELLR